MKIANTSLRPRKAGIVFLSTIVVIFGSLVSCQRQTNNSANPDNAPRLTALSLRLPWLYNVEAAGILLAQERGYFRENGIDLKIKPGGIGLDPVKLVSSGSDDIGICDGAALIIGAAQGMPVKAFATEYQVSPLCYITLKDSGIASVKDFSGKRIGTQVFQVYVLETMLAFNDMTLADVKVTPVQFDVRPLVEKQIDAFLSFVSDEPILLDMKGVKTNVIRAADNGYPFYSNAVFTTTQTLKEKPEVLAAFFRAVSRGWRDAISDPDAAADLVVDKYNKELNREQQRQGMAIIAKLVTHEVGGEGIGLMKRQVWEKSVTTLSTYKQIAKPIPAEDVYTTQILDAVYPPK